jgi:hypothetical protein
MTTELRKKMAALRAMGPSINAAADEANAAVAKVEELLGTIGISARVGPYDEEYTAKAGEDEDEDAAAPCVCSYLAFGRHAGTRLAPFRVHVVQETEAPDEESPFTDATKITDVRKIPWGELSREERLKAVTRLPELIDVIADRARQQVDKARESTAAVRELVEDLEAESINSEPE